ncbi:hypothetical protein CUMW_001300 [Citrus unshiu]|nr:hypothetical protein CUMW_001300 [Citrus unshiu]
MHGAKEAVTCPHVMALVTGAVTRMHKSKAQTSLRAAMRILQGGFCLVIASYQVLFTSLSD